MSDEIRLPADLQHLIEKRESSEQRQHERRTEKEGPTANPGSESATESADDSDDVALEDHQTEQKRRYSEDRRWRDRRKDDQD